MNTPSGLTIFSVATDKYLSYWIDLVDSYFANENTECQVQWLLLTDDASSIPETTKQLLGSNLVVRDIKHSPWPFPTLLRYQYILDSLHTVNNSDFVYLDADMLIVSKEFISTVKEALGRSNLVMVRHPGFYRESGVELIKFYCKHPKFIVKDLILRLRQGSIGTWESNRESSAFVPRPLRNEYVCGGIWFGKKTAIEEMCILLSRSIENDLANGVIAKFHDESHLNHFYSYNEITTMDPALCFDASYPQLSRLSPLVFAVDKNRFTK
jgi:hypothetical protein